MAVEALTFQVPEGEGAGAIDQHQKVATEEVEVGEDQTQSLKAPVVVVAEGEEAEAGPYWVGEEEAGA